MKGWDCWKKQNYKNNANLDTEINSLENLSKEKKSLSKNSSTSKNKNNLNIKTIHEKNTDNLYNNEEKNYLKLDEVNRLNLPSDKRFKSKKGNKRLKDLQKYFNDLGINEAYKFYIPQLNLGNSNDNNNSNNNFHNINIITNNKNNNQRKNENRYGQILPNLSQLHRITKNNSN